MKPRLGGQRAFWAAVGIGASLLFLVVLFWAELARWAPTVTLLMVMVPLISGTITISSVTVGAQRASSAQKRTTRKRRLAPMPTAAQNALCPPRRGFIIYLLPL